MLHNLGKMFYLELSGEGKMPVLHFGMTGKLQVVIMTKRVSNRGMY